MTLVAHYLSVALAATFALPAARYDAFALACVAAARASDVSACDESLCTCLAPHGAGHALWCALVMGERRAA